MSQYQSPIRSITVDVAGKPLEIVDLDLEEGFVELLRSSRT